MFVYAIQMRRGHTWCLQQSKELSPHLWVLLLCLQTEILLLGSFMLLCGLHKKAVESPLRPCSLSLPWEILTFGVLFFFSWVGVNKLGNRTAGGLLVSLWTWDFTAACWGSDLRVQGEDCESCWDTVEGLAPSVLCREREAWHNCICTAGSVRLCSKVISLPCLGFWPKELVSYCTLEPGSRLSYTQCRQLKDQGFSAKQIINWTDINIFTNTLILPEEELFKPIRWNALQI